MLASSAFAQTDWQLVWSDEFSGPANTAPDASKWVYATGRGPNNDGWGNQELETYTNDLANVHLDGSNLVIRAVALPSGGYTSGRLYTQGKFQTAYGKIEARIKIPKGQGIWPAFWMLGSDIATAKWPACGEIDIMENIGKEPLTVHATVHGPGYSGASGVSGLRTLGPGHELWRDFHTYAVIWTEGSLEFFLDSASYFKVIPANIPAGQQWVFNKPFYLLLNLAVGGNWPGRPDASTQFPQEMLVDYVRIYRNTLSGIPGPPNGVTVILR